MDHKNQNHEFLAEEAKRFNEQAVLGKEVRLETDLEKHDRYGRLLAYVYLDDGTMINRHLVERGLARVMTTRPNAKHRTELIGAQQKAMDSGHGIWSRPVTEKGTYVASKKSFRFHLLTCPYAKRIRSSNKILFKDRRIAFYNGYYPCSQCSP